MTSQRLIVCFDGTWNTPSSSARPTNVVKILRAITTGDDSVRQITYYDKGVGTGGPVDRLYGGMSGGGLTEKMIDGYRFLANNWRQGDEIFVFGFSRGAYTARNLVGFIDLAGMISPLFLGADLEKAIETYRKADMSRDQKSQEIDKLGVTRETEVRIRCIGVWDTVGSLGVPGDLGRRLLTKKYYFHDTLLSKKVDVALHAIAIDEKRSAFAPTLWCESENPDARNQVVEQVWFSGVHSNVGGSYQDSGLSDIALDWMIKRVRHHTGLAFDNDYVQAHIQPNARGKGVESRSVLYKDSTLYPYQRLIKQVLPDGKGFGEWFRRKFKALDRRNIVPGNLTPLNEMLHISALERCREPVVSDCPAKQDCKARDYRPPTLVALINSCKAGNCLIDVVGWDGEVVSPDDISWPW